jgi:hypothetical protein
MKRGNAHLVKYGMVMGVAPTAHLGRDGQIGKADALILILLMTTSLLSHGLQI